MPTNSGGTTTSRAPHPRHGNSAVCTTARLRGGVRGLQPRWLCYYKSGDDLCEPTTTRATGAPTRQRYATTCTATTISLAAASPPADCTSIVGGRTQGCQLGGGVVRRAGRHLVLRLVDRVRLRELLHRAALGRRRPAPPPGRQQRRRRQRLLRRRRPLLLLPPSPPPTPPRPAAALAAALAAAFRPSTARRSSAGPTRRRNMTIAHQPEHQHIRVRGLPRRSRRTERFGRARRRRQRQVRRQRRVLLQPATLAAALAAAAEPAAVAAARRRRCRRRRARLRRRHRRRPRRRRRRRPTRRSTATIGHSLPTQAWEGTGATAPGG